MEAINISYSASFALKYQEFLSHRYKEADRKTSYFVYGFFIFGLFLALYYNTWAFALGVGGASMAAYLLCYLLIPGSLLSRMVTSLVFAVYMLQFIGQMHGMYEMHFFFFINIAILIIYQDWRIMVPYTLFAILHHSFLFWVQMSSGYQLGQYFINLDTISITVMVFHLSLAALMGVICGWWSLVLQRRSQEEFRNKFTLETQLLNMQQNIAFATEISKGNLRAVHMLREDDQLGKSLLEMRNNLLTAHDREEQEKFKNVGLANINEILRNQNGNLGELTDQVLACIVKYMRLNQGGIFILNTKEGEEYLELMACYAYDRKKWINKRISPGEGLAGQAVLEKDTIFITDVPQEYCHITSGLGGANPGCIVVVPIKSNEKVVGVMEFASFQVLQPHQVQFLEKLADTIASAILSVQVNQTTKLLLQNTQQQAEELRAQEEEMRQNMEEMEATQEELSRKLRENEQMKKDLDAYLKALDAAALMSEADVYGNITYVNDRFCQVAKYSREEVIGKPHSILRHPDNPKELFREMWATIKAGKVFRGRYPNRAKDGSTYWVDATIEPVLGPDGKPVKYIGIRFDITEQVKKEQEIEALLKETNEHLKEIQQSEEELRQSMEEMQSTQEALSRREKESVQLQEELDARVQALNAAALMSEADVYGNITYVNSKFCEVAKYTPEEIIGKPHSILRHPDNPKELFKQMWNTIKSGQIFQGRYPNRAKDGSTYWVDATIVPVMGPDGTPVKYIGVRFDVTREMQRHSVQALQS